jgi:tripartite-type tricarboxylate transporter receptor subunit TctC
MMKFRTAAALAFALLLGSTHPLHAQTPPTKAVRFVVPFPAGGTADMLPRIVADKIRAQFPAGIVVENRSGAGGNIGAETVFRADPDGMTLLTSPPGPIAINNHLYKKLNFDPTRWVPITVLATVPNVLAVSNKLPVKDVPELIAYLKANPGKVSYASQGNGSTSHLTANMFMSLTGTNMIHVPYKGTAPALVDLIGGQVDLFFDNLSSSLPQHQGGKLRILAVADEQRSPALPNVPTLVESRIPGMLAVTWFAVVAPPGTPAAIVNSYQSAIASALTQPDVRQKFAEQGAEACGWAPDRTQRFIAAESERWGGVIKIANVTLE